MSHDIDKVRYSHAGHDFHFLWTARRSLGLLNPKSNLSAVSIEGISSEDNGSDEKGLLSIDTAEYYGSEKFDDAEKIKYFQLKYSTVDSAKEWSAAGLSPRKKGEAKGTIVSFAINFKDNLTKYGLSIIDKYEYYFVTNRPIQAAIKSLLILNRRDKQYNELSKTVQAVYNRFYEDCNLSEDEFKIFLKMLYFLDVQDPRFSQQSELLTEVNKFVPGFDTDISLKLKELVYTRAMPEYSHHPVITKATLLHAFGVTKSSDLLPAQASFEFIKHYIPRDQEINIANTIIDALYPVVIHAPGGVGKSSVAQHLPFLMPHGSEAVIFDGFANGAYRSAVDQRHLHKNGLVQIVNEFAFRGLCLPILRTDSASDDYLKIFYSRLEDVVAEVKQISSDAIVLIVLDAADNSEMAAQEYNQISSFAKDLLQLPPPIGCKVVALCRSERVNLLTPTPNTLSIELQPFSIEETQRYLKTKFTDIDNGQLVEFHKLTFGNPRVQSYLLASNQSLREILKQLGHQGLSSEALIESQFEQSLLIIKDQAYSKNEIDLLCHTLALLRPMIPMDVLSIATGINENVIYSFASDMGLALLIKDAHIQFRDEPVETWFRKKFEASKSLYEKLSTNLLGLSKTNTYVASTMPRILFGAEQFESLYDIVFNSSSLEIDDPIQKQIIILENLIYSIKLAKKRHDFMNLAKLLLEASKIISSKDRHSEFILDNSDLIATLVGPEFINDFLYREKPTSNNGMLYAHSALMLSMEPLFHAEARSFLRLTDEYIREWSNLSADERRQNSITIRDVGNIVLAVLYLFDANHAFEELELWLSKNFKFDVARMITKHLIEQNNDTQINELLYVFRKTPYLLGAVIIELHRMHKPIPTSLIERGIKVLLKFSRSDKLSSIIICIAETAIQNGIDQEEIVRLLEKHYPKLNPYVSTPTSKEEEDNRDLLLKHITLLKSLKNEEILLSDFIPESAKNNREDEFNLVYGQLFPLYKIRAKLLIKFSEDIETIIQEMLSILQKISSNSWRYKNQYRVRDVPYLAAYISMDILFICRRVKQYEIVSEWLKSTYEHIPDFVWINLLNHMAFIDKKIALSFADLAYKSILSEKKTSYLSSNYSRLARAVLPINKEDAKAYFELAMEVNTTLGEDARRRVDSLCDITEYLEQGYRNPKQAYELLQVCEMVHEFNDNKFPWYGVINAIKNIDNTSSLAIASRLKDRAVVSFDSTLSLLFNKLLEQKEISPQVYASIFTLTKNDIWKLPDGIKKILDLYGKSEDTQYVIEMLIWDFYINFNDYASYYVKKIKDVLDEYSISNQLIDNLIVMSPKKDNLSQYLQINKTDEDEIDWNDIFLDCVCTSVNSINDSYERFRQKTNHAYISLFYNEMRRRVPIDKRVEHLIAYSEYNEHIDNFFDELEEYAREWTSIAVQKYIPSLIEKIFRSKAKQIVGSYRIKDDIEIAEKLSGKSKRQLMMLLLENSIENISNYSYETILTIFTEISYLLSPEEISDVLTFGIQQFKDDIEIETSDGGWREELTPPIDMNETIGAFIYVYLGSTRSEERWRAMHAVRRLCRFGEKGIIENVLKQLDMRNIKAYTDEKYMFYDMHAKLYLFIALARGVKENPTILLDYSDTFKFFALDWYPHILIKKYCSEIALALELTVPGTYPPEVIEKLNKINKTPFELENISGYSRRQKKLTTENSKKLTLSFDLDWEPYWFEPLSDVFGITSKDISSIVENWIVEKWKFSDSIAHWDKDLRAKHKIYREGETYYSHYEYPKEDDLHFYLTYHAMFCTAGELLATYPIRYRKDYEENLWESWLSRHILTREDGKWVSDRKDIMPIDLYFDVSEEINKENWQFSVQSEDFDRCLRLNQPDFKFLPINGNWKINSEDVDITSALINSKSSDALLRALQTVENPNDAYLAPYHDSNISKDSTFIMSGWVSSNSSTELRLDQFDPLAKIAYPPVSPAPNIQRLCKLTADSERRIWKDPKGEIAFNSQVWGDFKEYTEYGERLQINYDFLLGLLGRINKDLLVKVEIKREKKYRNTSRENVYYYPYFKLYLFKKDGTVHGLYNNNKVR